MKVFVKQNGDRLDYDIDLSKWMVEGDEVDSADVVYDTDSDIVYVGKTLFADRVKLWISGGTVGESYPFDIFVHTEGGRTKEVNILITVIE